MLQLTNNEINALVYLLSNITPKDLISAAAVGFAQEATEKENDCIKVLQTFFDV